MTNEEAIAELKEDIDLYIPLNGTVGEIDRDLPDGRLVTALEMAIKALDLVDMLTNRPCGVCKHHEHGLCSSWNCPFSEKEEK